MRGRRVAFPDPYGFCLSVPIGAPSQRGRLRWALGWGTGKLVRLRLDEPALSLHIWGNWGSERGGLPRIPAGLPPPLQAALAHLKCTCTWDASTSVAHTPVEGCLPCGHGWLCPTWQ